MSKAPITNPVLTAVIGLIGLAVSFFCARALLFPDLQISEFAREEDQPGATYCGLLAGLTTFVGCGAIYLRKRWGYRCASVGMFIFAAGIIYRLAIAGGPPLHWLWAIGYFGMAMHFWITGRPPRKIRRVVSQRPTLPPENT